MSKSSKKLTEKQVVVKKLEQFAKTSFLSDDASRILTKAANIIKGNPKEIDFDEAHIDPDGRTISDERASYFKVARNSDNYKNYIDTCGHLSFDDWYPDVEPMVVTLKHRKEAIAIVTRAPDSLQNAICLSTGGFIIADWMDTILISTNGKYALLINKRDEYYGYYCVVSLESNAISSVVRANNRNVKVLKECVLKYGFDEDIVRIYIPWIEE